jgi:hypothetical protein
MDVERITDWLWCLRTPLVQSYAVRHSDGFHLIDTSTAGHDGAILDALGSVAGSAGPRRGGPRRPAHSWP